MAYDEVQIGECRLIRGDARDVLPTLGAVDACITDPPYGIALAHHGYSRTGPARDIIGDQDGVLGEAVLAWARTRGCTLVAFASPEHPWPGPWRSLVVWDKGPGVGSGGDPRLCFKRTWELVQIWNTLPLQCGRDGAVLTRWVFNLDHRYHPAEKPVDVLAYFIQQVTLPGQTVCDPCMGSGSTGVACVQLARSFVGIEIDPGYFQTACRRVEEAYRQLQLFPPSAPALPPQQLGLLAKDTP